MPGCVAHASQQHSELRGAGATPIGVSATLVTLLVPDQRDDATLSYLPARHLFECEAGWRGALCRGGADQYSNPASYIDFAPQLEAATMLLLWQ